MVDIPQYVVKVKVGSPCVEGGGKEEEREGGRGREEGREGVTSGSNANS